MSIGLIGKKCGMTRLYAEDGTATPVTVIEIVSNRVVQIKTKEKDGYNAVQVSAGSRKHSRIRKPLAGHYAKANVAPGHLLREFDLKDSQQLEQIHLGDELKADVFSIGQYIDVSGVTKGKGFAGAIKRHHFSSQDRSHGGSLCIRKPGSIGQRQSPGKVFKGKKMTGHLGDVMRTMQSLKIAGIDLNRNLLLVKGAVPGAVSTYLMIRQAVKKSNKGEANASEAK
jgi:large subunit ribosomal protein L3